MTNKETRNAAQTMLDYISGHIIQCRERTPRRMHQTDGLWSDCSQEPKWNWETFDYRTKPEPMEIQVWTKNDGTLALDAEPHAANLYLQRPGNFEAAGWTKKKFREVIE